MSARYARRWIAIFGLLVTAGVCAGPVEVELLRPPAWLEAAGERHPLEPGAVLAPTHRIVVGTNARVVLALAEGSSIKLGAETRFALNTLAPTTSDGVFRAAFDILRGAFRFTTSALAATTRREIDARVGTATIGIRGTDVWGRASPERDFVVLIEGVVDISRHAERVTLSEPLSLFNAPQGAPAEPLRKVEPAELSGYAAETEAAAGAGSMRGDGQWRVEFGAFRQKRFATIVAATLRAEGYPVGRQAADTVPARWHVRLDGFVTRADADAIATRLATRYPALRPRATPRA